MKCGEPDKSRRSFLRRAAAASAAAGAAATSLDAAAEVVAGEEKSPQKNGYRLTDHVKAYYKSLTR